MIYIDYTEIMRIHNLDTSSEDSQILQQVLYLIGALLTNFRSLFYNNQTSAYFDCETMSLSEYLALID